MWKLLCPNFRQIKTFGGALAPPVLGTGKPEVHFKALLKTIVRNASEMSQMKASDAFLIL